MTPTNATHATHAATELGAEGWAKPWSGTNGEACVETKRLPGGNVAVRQSRNPDGPAVIFNSAEMTAFVTGVKAGDADYLTAPAPVDC